MYTNWKFCLVPLYIKPNNKSLTTILVEYKQLIKTIWPVITLLKHNIRKCLNQEIESDDDDIEDYHPTIKLYNSSAIIKTKTINNVI